jgi:hypothetical protein
VAEQLYLAATRKLDLAVGKSDLCVRDDDGEEKKVRDSPMEKSLARFFISGVVKG